MNKRKNLVNHKEQLIDRFYMFFLMFQKSQSFLMYHLNLMFLKNQNFHLNLMFLKNQMSQNFLMNHLYQKNQTYH
jgi:hypothetical protein